MERLTNQERLKPWMGIVFFLVVMLVFVTVCGLMQLYWGIPGLIATEVLLAGMAVAFAKLRKVKLSEVFPIKKITIKDFFGCILLLIGGYLFSIASIYLMATIFPSSMSEAEGINDMLYSGGANYFYLLFAVAVLPAICEEMLHRGAILSSFRGVKHEWIAIVAVGLTFSINHLSILRGPFTFILGATLAWVLIKRNNILLTMLMHGLLNGFSVTTAYFTSKTTDLGEAAGAVTQADSLTLLGSILTVACAAPVIYLTGMMLISPKTHRARRYIWAVLAGVVMLISGIAITYISTYRSMLANAELDYTIEEAGSMSEAVTFTIEEESDHQVVVTMMNAKGDYTVILQDDEGNVACQGEISDGTIRMYQQTVTLEPDDYEVYIESGEGTVGEHPTISILVK